MQAQARFTTQFDRPRAGLSVIGLLVLVALAALMIFSLTQVVAAPVGAIDLSASHGETKHGDAAVFVRNCLNEKGALQEWTNASNGRRARVCEIVPGQFGIQILEEAGNGVWREITGFIKNKMTRLDQVMNYLKNTGYNINQ